MAGGILMNQMAFGGLIDFFIEQFQMRLGLGKIFVFDQRQVFFDFFFESVFDDKVVRPPGFVFAAVFKSCSSLWQG